MKNINQKRNPRCRFIIQEELKFKELYEKGWHISKIAKKFSTSLHGVHRILKIHNTKLRSHGEGTRLLHKHLEIEQPKDFPNKLKDKFHKLIAVFLLTDGYFKKGGGNMLICTDKILQSYFVNLFKEKYALTPTANSYMLKGKETIINSKYSQKELIKLSPSYNTYPRNKTVEKYLSEPQPTLSFLNNDDEELLKEVLRIAMSCEGSIFPEFSQDSVRPHLQFACSHLQLLREWQELFKKVGIKSHILKSKVTWSGVKGLGIKELKSIKRFIEIGGFINGVKITGKSKYFKGIEKNKLLTILVEMREDSFQFPKERDSKAKNEIVRDIIQDSKAKDFWWNKCVEGPRLKRIEEKELRKKEVLNYIKKEVAKGYYPGWNNIEDKFHIAIEAYFKDGLKTAYKETGIDLVPNKKWRKSIMDARKEKTREKIIDYVKNSVKKGFYPTWKDIEEKFNIHYVTYFSSIVEIYKKAGTDYPRIIKKSMNKQD